MNKINWRVRVKSKSFWLSVISALILLVQAVLAPLGLTIDFGTIGNYCVTVVNAVFGLLAVLGVVNDPTTDGLTDSKQALTYEAPKKD